MTWREKSHLRQQQGRPISMNQALDTRSDRGGFFVAVLSDPETGEVLKCVELLEVQPKDKGRVVELSVEFYSKTQAKRTVPA